MTEQTGEISTISIVGTGIVMFVAIVGVRYFVLQ